LVGKGKHNAPESGKMADRTARMKGGKIDRDGSVGGGKNRAGQRDRRIIPTLVAEHLRALKEEEKPEVKTARTRRWGEKRRANGDQRKQAYPSDGKTFARRPTVIPGDATFSGRNIPGSSDEEGKFPNEPTFFKAVAMAE
jgi:hypothetical protein